MPWRFYRRFNLVPGLRFNLSRSGVSVSIGHSGSWYTIGAAGLRATNDLPGSGIFYTRKTPQSKEHWLVGPQHAIQITKYEQDPVTIQHKVTFMFVLLLLLALTFYLVKW